MTSWNLIIDYSDAKHAVHVHYDSEAHPEPVDVNVVYRSLPARSPLTP